MQTGQCLADGLGLVDVKGNSIENDLPAPIEEEEESAMAFSEDNQKWIRDEIAKAVDELKPHGFRKFIFKLREYGAVAIPFTIVLALIAMVITLGMAYVNRSTAEASFQATTTFRLGEIDKSMAALSQKLSGTQLSVLANAPIITEQTVKQAIEVVATAQQAGEKLDTRLISSAGQKFVEASEREPEAWKAALVFANYKSFANPTPAFIPPAGGTLYARYRVAAVPGQAPPTLRVVGQVAKESAAEFAPIGVDRNAQLAEGNQYIFAEGGSVVLDNMQLRNVVLKNVRITYGGGPLRLTDVYFINCTFEMEQDRNTQGFAIAALAPDPATSFSAE
jgi:hypothetical protein